MSVTLSLSVSLPLPVSLPLFMSLCVAMVEVIIFVHFQCHCKDNFHVTVRIIFISSISVVNSPSLSLTLLLSQLIIYHFHCVVTNTDMVIIMILTKHDVSSMTAKGSWREQMSFHKT